MTNPTPRVSIIVPTRDGAIAKLKASLDAQTFRDYELIVVAGVSPAGRARNQGVQQAQADLLLFIDDDAFCGAPDMLERLVGIADERSDFAVIGPAKILPPNASSLQRRIAHEVPRWVFPITNTLIESNPTTEAYGFTALSTTCILMRRACFEAVGGFDETLPTGPEDTEFFYRLRKLGARFAVAPHTWVCHPTPTTLPALLRKSFAYGTGHAFEAWAAPERRMQIVPLDRWYGKALVLLSPLLFVPSLFIGYYFDPIRHVQVGWRPIKALSTYAMLYGYTYGWYHYRHRNKGVLAHSMTDLTPIKASASRSSLVTGVAFFGIAVLNFAYANVMAWLLPVEGYGLLGLIQSCILLIATLVRAGFPWGLARVLSSGPSTSDAYRAAKSGLVGNLLIALGYSLVLLLAVAFAGLSFGAHSVLILSLIVVEAVLMAVATLLAGVLQGTMRFGLLGLGQAVETLVKLAAGVALVLLGYGVAGATSAIVLGSAVLLAIIAWHTRRFTFWREPAWGARHTYRDSLTIFVGLCALTVIGNIDIIGLKLFSHPGQSDTLAGYYQAAIVLPRIPVLLAGAYATALFPYLARDNHAEIGAYIIQALKYGLLLILPANLLLVAIPEQIIGLIYPDVYLVSASALRIAALGSCFLALATILISAFQARGLARVPARWLPIAAVAEIVALWLLVPSYNIAGAAVALLIGSTVACACLWFVLAREFHYRIALGNIARYVGVSGALVVVTMLLPHSNRLWTLASSTIALLVYVVLLALARLIRPPDLAVLTSGLPLDRVAPMAALVERFTGLVDRLNRIVPLHDSARARY
jgi:O-antigen/teichoic acid export membrane protein/glycosyltransferase involved in cell wall biosynthesis